MNTSQLTTKIKVSRPAGMTVAEFKRRKGQKPTSNHIGKSCQSLRSSVGLNTSGALAGLRASSFPNPPMAPPYN